MGMLPSSQYGSVAVLPSVLAPADSSSRVYAYTSGTGSVGSILNASSSKELSVNNTSTSARYASLNSDLSALSIRATEYLQRWKEVVQFSSKDYSDQMAAQFGIKAPEYMSNHAQDRKSTRLNSSHITRSRMPSSA